jgi:LuxR family maltose regulon positive regulatory protein
MANKDYDATIALVQKAIGRFYLAGELDAVIQWLQQVPHHHLEQRPCAASLLARLLTERGWFDDARAWIDVATREAATDRERLEVLRGRIRLERALGRESAVLASLAELDVLVDAVSDPEVRDRARCEQARTLSTRAMSHEFLGHGEQRWASLTELDRRRPELDQVAALTVDPSLARAYAEAGELRPAASHARLAISRARRDGVEPQFLTHAYLAIAHVEWCRSRLDDAELMLRHAGSLDDGTSVWTRTLRSVRAAEILASLGRHDQVDDILESAWRGTPGARTPPASRCMIAGWGLAIAARHGRRDTASSWLAELNRIDDHAATIPTFLWAEAELLSDNPRALIERFGLDGHSLPSQPLPRLRCALALARALETTGHDAEFVPVLETLLTHAENHELLQPLIESQNVLAHLGSTSTIDSSPRFLERLGAPTCEQFDVSTLDQLSEPLTQREADLIRLLPSRLTNREIATELYVSVNTVKSHLRSIYRKLEVSSRNGAIDRCRQLEILT